MAMTGAARWVTVASQLRWCGAIGDCQRLTGRICTAFAVAVCARDSSNPAENIFYRIGDTSASTLHHPSLDFCPDAEGLLAVVSGTVGPRSCPPAMQSFEAGSSVGPQLHVLHLFWHIDVWVYLAKKDIWLKKYS